MAEENSVMMSLKELQRLEQQRQDEEAEAIRKAAEEERRKAHEASLAALEEQRKAELERIKAETERKANEAVIQARVKAAYDAEVLAAKREAAAAAERARAAAEMVRLMEPPKQKGFPVGALIAMLAGAVTVVVSVMLAVLRREPDPAPAPVVSTVVVKDDKELQEAKRKLDELERLMQEKRDAGPKVTPSVQPKMIVIPKDTKDVVKKPCPPGVPLCD